MANESLKAKLEAYEAACAKSYAKTPERVGLKHNKVYTPLDIEGFDYERDLGIPGEYPYTRGVQPTMYRGRLWTMRMYAGFATAEESNKRYRYLIENGGSGLSCAFDLPTQIGYDSDDKMAIGEIGKVGVAIDTLKDMEILFDHIDLGKVSTSMTINAPASVLLAMYIAVAEKQGVPADQLRGTIQNDILKEYAARGTYIFPVKPSMRLITNIFEYCSKNVPKWNTISISGYHIREAGSTAAQEIAFTIADGIAYIEAAAKEYIRKIDEMGGAVEAIDKGYIQKEIQDSAYAWQMAVESGERTIVGVNKFTMEEAPVEGLLKVDASAGEFQKNKLAKVKAERDNAKVKEELAKLEVAAADESVNLMPVILDCVRAYCSLGEICGVLRKVFGEYKAHNTL